MVVGGGGCSVELRTTVALVRRCGRSHGARDSRAAAAFMSCPGERLPLTAGILPARPVGGSGGSRRGPSNDENGLVALPKEADCSRRAWATALALATKHQFLAAISLYSNRSVTPSRDRLPQSAHLHTAPRTTVASNCAAQLPVKCRMRNQHSGRCSRAALLACVATPALAAAATPKASRTPAPRGQKSRPRGRVGGEKGTRSPR